MDWGFKPGKEAGEKEEAGLCLPHCSSYCSCQFRAVLCGLLLPSALPSRQGAAHVTVVCGWDVDVLLLLCFLTSFGQRPVRTALSMSCYRNSDVFI